MKEIKFDFETLLAYKKSLDYIDFVYNTCSDFPFKDNSSVTNPYMESANAIALHLSKSENATSDEFNRYLSDALNEVTNCAVYSSIACRRGYINESSDKLARIQLKELSKMIKRLQKNVPTLK